MNADNENDTNWVVGAAAAAVAVLGLLPILDPFEVYSKDDNNNKDECFVGSGVDSCSFNTKNFVAVVVEISIVVQVALMMAALLLLLLLFVGGGWSQRLRSFRLSTQLQRQQQLSPSVFSIVINELLSLTRWRRNTTTATNEAPQSQPQQQLLLLSSEHVDMVAKRQWSEVLAWIVFHPDELRYGVDRQGQTFLHHACLFRAPAEVLQMILWQAPELAARANPHGQVPLHWAVRLSLPNECLQALILAAPKTPCWAEDLLDTTTPLSLLWDRHKDYLWSAWERWQYLQQSASTTQQQQQQQPNQGEQNYQIIEHNFFQSIKNLPAWKRIILCWPCRCQPPSSEIIIDPTKDDEEYQYHTYQHHHQHKNSKEKENDETLLRFLESPLHVASRSPCPPDLYSFLLESQVFSSSKHAMPCDAWGRLPLHVVCSNATTNRSSSVAAFTISTTSEIENFAVFGGAGPRPEEEQAATAGCTPTKLQQWLQSSSCIPDPKTACCTRDYQGRTPFHYALASGISWEEGMKDMILLDPDWMLRDGPAVRDPITLLLPFLLAAAATAATMTISSDGDLDGHDGKNGGERKKKDSSNKASSSSSDSGKYHLANGDDNAANPTALVAAPLDTIYNILRMDPTHIILASLPHTTYR